MTSPSSNKTSNQSPERMAHFLLKNVNKAIRDHRLIEDGDRVAVAVSGGKDSLALLRLLEVRRRYAPEKYEVCAIHITPAIDAPCTEDTDQSRLEDWFRQEGVPYLFVPMEEAHSQAKRKNLSPCFHCARRRRKALFLAAEELGCKKIGFGHHSDDMAQTTLLNLFYQGNLETMHPRMEFFDGAMTIIRPLAYVEEKAIRRFAKACGFPPASDSCGTALSSKRVLMGDIIRQVEKTCSSAKVNLWRALERAEVVPTPDKPESS